MKSRLKYLFLFYNMLSYTLAVVAFPWSKLWLKSQLANRSHSGHNTSSALETHQYKSSEVIIPVLEHAKLHFGTGRDSVREIMIKHPN